MFDGSHCRAPVTTIAAMPTRERLTNTHDDGEAVTGPLAPGQGQAGRRGAAQPKTPPLVARFPDHPRHRRAPLGGGVAAGALYLRSVDKSVKRVDAFQQVPEAARPPRAVEAKGAMNYLILGSDTRDPQNTDGSRSDTIILMHVDKARSAAQLVSIPRDTWTHIPKAADGKHGDTTAKINAAYAWGGVPLTVQTVESFTGVRIDHVDHGRLRRLQGDRGRARRGDHRRRGELHRDQLADGAAARPRTTTRARS